MSLAEGSKFMRFEETGEGGRKCVAASSRFEIKGRSEQQQEMDGMCDSGIERDDKGMPSFAVF